MGRNECEKMQNEMAVEVDAGSLIEIPSGYSVDEDQNYIHVYDKNGYRVATITKKNEEKVKEEQKDNVNHPSHYEKSCSIECIDAMRCAYGTDAVFDFCICNAFKYIWRFRSKNGYEDLDKASWYLNFAKKLINQGHFDTDSCKSFEDYAGKREALNMYIRTNNMLLDVYEKLEKE